jgi:hypothetical protein
LTHDGEIHFVVLELPQQLLPVAHKDPKSDAGVGGVESRQEPRHEILRVAHHPDGDHAGLAPI